MDATAPALTVVPAPAEPEDDVALLAELAATRGDLVAELGKRIVGQDAVIDHLITALFSGGHCLFVGVPGLAKTRLVATLAEALGLSFQRIQFTPDLMPADVTGSEILEEDPASGRRSFRFAPGPVFANLVLADEINRTPPKTQAALLQAMQEHQVTAGGRTYPLPPPFLVMATQNPIEQEGTYPLPEAQLDRFLFQIDVVYPSEAEEAAIVRLETAATTPSVRVVLAPARLLVLQALVRRVPVADHVVAAAVRLARASRPAEPSAPAFVRDYVAWGAGPRASQGLILAAKARAALAGRFAVTTEDVAALARPILAHRVLLNYRAEAEGVRAGDLVERLVASLGG